MKQYARVVEVPGIEKEEKAYNHDRPISSLVMHQLRHLYAAEQGLPEKDRTNINISQLHTELEASKYIQKVMKKLHPKEKKKKVRKTSKGRLGTRVAKRQISRRKRK